MNSIVFVYYDIRRFPEGTYRAEDLLNAHAHRHITIHRIQELRRSGYKSKTTYSKNGDGLPIRVVEMVDRTMATISDSMEPS